MHKALKPSERILTDSSLIGRDFVLRDLFMGTQQRGPIKTIEEECGGTHILITTERAAQKQSDGMWVEVPPIAHAIQKNLKLVDYPGGTIAFDIDIEAIGIICPPGVHLDADHIRSPE